MDATLMTATEAMTAGDGESDHDELVKLLRIAIDACHKKEIKQFKAERDEAVKLLQDYLDKVPRHKSEEGVFMLPTDEETAGFINEATKFLDKI